VLNAFRLLFYFYKRTSLEAEEREFERERDLAGSKRVAWNHHEFEVYYPSLDGEIRIGNHYVRLLFDSGGVGDGAVRQLRNPAHFFVSQITKIANAVPQNVVCN